MTEFRCKTCHKVLAYIKSGSRIADGVVMHCAPCSEAINTKPAHDIPDFLRGFMKGKK